MDVAEPSPPRPSPANGRQRFLRPIMAGVVMLVLNVVVYVLPIDYGVFGNYAYVGVFLITLIANATVVVPVPYPAIVAGIAAQSPSLVPVVFAGALGSAIGESVAFFVGRTGRGVVERTRFYVWVQGHMRHPWRAFLVLFLLAAPPNPLFDVAGITAGALGVSFWLFFGAVFLGRVIRVGLFALLGVAFGA